MEAYNTETAGGWLHLPRMNFKRRQHACTILEISREDRGILVSFMSSRNLLEICSAVFSNALFRQQTIAKQMRFMLLMLIIIYKNVRYFQI